MKPGRRILVTQAASYPADMFVTGYFARLPDHSRTLYITGKLSAHPC